jgi:hypothetical protein
MFPTEQKNVIHVEPVPPVQFDSIWRRSTPPTSVRALLLAMLDLAASDLQFFRFRRRREAQRMYWEAHQWVMSDDRSHPFTFVNICEALKLSPDVLRSGLLGTDQDLVTRAA